MDNQTQWEKEMFDPPSSQVNCQYDTQVNCDYRNLDPIHFEQFAQYTCEQIAQFTKIILASQKSGQIWHLASIELKIWHFAKFEW